MSKRVYATGGQTFTAAATGGAIANNTYMALFGAASTQLIDVLEVLVSGMATASTVAAMRLGRASTIHSSATALASPSSDGFEFPNASALSSSVVSFNSAVTGPTPSATVTDAGLNLGLNLFGGILRWNAAPTQQWQVIGNTAPGGESVLWNSSTHGGSSGLANAHLLYEPY